jgi:hypothetical protein
MSGLLALCDALKTNSSLRDLECAPHWFIPNPTNDRCYQVSAADSTSLLPCSRACVSGISLGSLLGNDVGVEGGKALGAALEINKSITSLK